MAYNSIYTGQQIDETIRGAEWYNLRCLPNGRIEDGVFNFNRQIVIENALPKLTGNDYRLVYMRENRAAGKGLHWVIPMFGSLRESRDAWLLTDTYKPVTGTTTAVVFSTEEFYHSVRTKKIPTQKVYYFLRSKNSKQRVGYALFKNTGVGTFGWQRVSNIVGIAASIGNKQVETSAHGVCYSVFSE